MLLILSNLRLSTVKPETGRQDLGIRGKGADLHQESASTKHHIRRTEESCRKGMDVDCLQNTFSNFVPIGDTQILVVMSGKSNL